MEEEAKKILDEVEAAEPKPKKAAKSKDGWSRKDKDTIVFTHEKDEAVLDLLHNGITTVSINGGSKRTFADTNAAKEYVNNIYG